jgi:hypothetical protein
VLSNYIGPLPLGFAVFRLVVVLLALAGLAVLWRRPRPRAALFLVVAANLVAWAAYVAPLQRLFALDEGGDRAYLIGMASGVAVGLSPLEHVQFGLGSPEPFWNAALALLAGLRPERVMAVLHWLAPASLVLVAWGLYAGLRPPSADPADDWERVLIVFAALLLSSTSLHPRPPVPALWMANFLYKPHHALAWALLGLAVGLRAHRPRAGLGLGLVLGLLGWVFLLHWAYLAAGLVAALVFGRGERHLRPLSVALLVSGLVVAPYVGHLLRDYHPAGSGATAQHMWGDPHGLPLAVPTWSTLDLGPLLVLGAAGAWCAWRRRTPRDRVLLGLAAATWGLFLVSIPGALWGIAPEPDELHYFLRFVTALLAGVALAAGGRHVEAAAALRPGQGALLALAACLPWSFVAYWDPPAMDRYYGVSLTPLRPKVLEYGKWVRESTRPDARFVAGRSAAVWIPALSGRKVLLAENGKLLPPDHAARKALERVLLTEGDEATVRQAAAAYGITHVAVDEPLVQEYGRASFQDLAPSPAWRQVFANAAARILELRGMPSPPPGDP